MKKIVIITFGDITKPENGYLIRVRMMVDTLAKSNHVTVLQYTGYDGDSLSDDGVRIVSMSVQHEKQSHGQSLGFNPFKELYFQIEGKSKLKTHKDIISAADEVYIEGCLLWQAFWFAKSLKKHIVLDTHCINRAVAEKMKAERSFIGTVRSGIWYAIEKPLMLKSDELIFVSEYDREIAKKYYKTDKKQNRIIENSVNPADYQKHAGDAQKIRDALPSDRKIAVYLGDLGAIQNREAADYIESELAPNAPEFTFLLVGNNPDKRPDSINVIHTGFVDQLDPYIIMADVCIAPLSIGSGTKTKMLDYMKYNKSIVSTPVGAEGLDVNMHNILIAERNKFGEAMRKAVS